MEVSLREYIERIIDEREKAHLAQLDSADRQLRSTASALDIRLESMNEFRRQIDHERALYVRRDQLEAILASRDVVIDQLSKSVKDLENWRSNVLGRQLIFGGAVIVLAGIVSAALRLVGH